MVQPRVARADAQGGGVAVEHDGAQAVHRQPCQRPATALLLLLCEVVQQVRALGVQTQITRRVGGVDRCIHTRKLQTVREITGKEENKVSLFADQVQKYAKIRNEPKRMLSCNSFSLRRNATDKSSCPPVALGSVAYVSPSILICDKKLQ